METSEPQCPPPAPSRTGVLVVAAILVFATGLAVVARVGRVQVRPRVAVADARPVLAVLPVRRLSADPEAAIVAARLTHELAERSVGRLEARARVVLPAFDAGGRSAAELARELGAAFVLETAIVDAGAGRVVRAQLVRARDGRRLWSFEKSAAESPVALAAAILAGVEAALTRSGEPRGDRPGSPDARGGETR